jgi:hypothetical protein
MCLHPCGACGTLCEHMMGYGCIRLVTCFWRCVGCMLNWVPMYMFVVTSWVLGKHMSCCALWFMVHVPTYFMDWKRVMIITQCKCDSCVLYSTFLLLFRVPKVCQPVHPSAVGPLPCCPQVHSFSVTSLPYTNHSINIGHSNQHRS